MEKVSVNQNQEHNPVLKLIRNVPWEYSLDELVDYRLGKSSGLLFLSVKYHRLHPNYIYERLRAVPKTKFRLQVVLLQLDDPHNWARSDRTIREITRAGLLLNWTILLAWSEEEAARWIESLHSLQRRSAALIREKSVSWNGEAILGEISGINKTDGNSLMAMGKNLKGVAMLTSKEISSIRGFGRKKTESFMNALDAPFQQ